MQSSPKVPRNVLQEGEKKGGGGGDPSLGETDVKNP